MEAIAQTRKKRTVFHLSTGLLDRLKEKAVKEQQSVDDLVEELLLDAIYHEPNEATIEAIEEARAGRYAGTLDASNFEAFMKSVEAIED